MYTSGDKFLTGSAGALNKYGSIGVAHVDDSLIKHLHAGSGTDDSAKGSPFYALCVMNFSPQHALSQGIDNGLREI